MGRTFARTRLSPTLPVLLLFLAVGCGASAPVNVTHTPSPLPGTSGVRGLYVLPDDGREPILAELALATTSIDLAVYLLSDDLIVNALLEAEDRGVEVRVILDPAPYGGPGDAEQVVRRLQTGGVDVRWGVHDVRFTHVKSIVIDDAVALILNVNLTGSSFVDNREFGIVTTVPHEVGHAEGIFEADWRGDVPPPGPLVLSPVDSRATVAGLIQMANAQLDVYAEVIRDPAIVDLLVAAAGRGVDVRVIVRPDDEPVFAGILEKLVSGGVSVGLLTSPYTHAKAIAVDGARLFVGSQNLTATSLDENRELGIVVADPTALARFSGVFERDWSSALPAEVTIATPLANAVGDSR